MIKVFTAEDVPSFLPLFVRVFNGEPWRDRWTDDTARAYLRELAEHPRFLGFAFWDGAAPAGAVLGHLKSHYRGDELFIDELFVCPDRRRRGHGAALMDAVERFAGDRALAAVTLLTGREKPSFAFFGKRGFRHLPHLAFMHKRPDPRGGDGG